MPAIDCHAAAQTRNALAGGVWADAPGRRAAARLEAAVPDIRRLYLRARKFHARAASWAVTEAATEGVVYLAAGIPQTECRTWILRQGRCRQASTCTRTVTVTRPQSPRRSPGTRQT